MRKMMFFFMALVLVLFSISSCTNTAEWREFVGPDGDFSVQLPGDPQETTQEYETDSGLITIHLFTFPLNKFAFITAYSDYPAELIQSKGIETVLNNARDGAIANTEGKLIEEKVFDLNGYPGRFLTVASPDGSGIAQAKLVLVGTRLYQVFVAGPEDQQNAPEISTYMDSFKLLK